MNTYQISSILNGDGIRKNRHALNRIKAHTKFGAKMKIKKLYKDKYNNCKVKVKSVNRIYSKAGN